MKRSSIDGMVVETSRDAKWIVQYVSVSYNGGHSNVGHREYRYDGGGDTYIPIGGGETGSGEYLSMSMSHDGQYIAVLEFPTYDIPSNDAVTGCTFVHLLEYQDDVIGYSSVGVLPNAILNGAEPNKLNNTVAFGTPVSELGEYTLIVSNLPVSLDYFNEINSITKPEQNIGGDFYLTMFEKVGSTWSKVITDVVIGDTASIPVNTREVNGSMFYHYDTHDIYYGIEYQINQTSNVDRYYYLKYPYTGGILNAELIFEHTQPRSYLFPHAQKRGLTILVSKDQTLLYLSYYNVDNDVFIRVYSRPNSLTPYSFVKEIENDTDGVLGLNEDGTRLIRFVSNP